MKYIMQKQNTITPIFLVLFVLLLANACSSAPQIIENSTATSVIVSTASELPVITMSSTPITTPIGIISSQEALAQMYGKDIRVQSNYDNYNPCDAILTTLTGGTYYVRINLLNCYRDDLGDEKCLLITDKSSHSTCQICGTYIDAAIFDRTASGWKIHDLKLDMIQLSPHGQIPKGEIIQIGRGKYAALLKGTYGNQGHYNEKLVIIAEIKGTLSVVFELTSSAEYITADESHEAIRAWGFNSTVKFYPDENNNEYSKLVVTYYGTDQDGKTPPLQTYSFSDTKYVLSYVAE